MSKTVHFVISLVIPIINSDGMSMDVYEFLRDQISEWNKSALEHVGYANEKQWPIEGTISQADVVTTAKSGEEIVTTFSSAWQFSGQSSWVCWVEGNLEPVPVEFYKTLRKNLRQLEESEDDFKEPPRRKLTGLSLIPRFSYSDDESLLYLNLRER